MYYAYLRVGLGRWTDGIYHCTQYCTQYMHHHGTMSSSTTAPQQRSFFSIPPIVKALFEAFPLITYPADPAPARSPKPSTLPRLYAWISVEEARRPGGGGYSFDAECLKWQVGDYFRLFARFGLRKLIHCGNETAAGGGGGMCRLISGFVGFNSRLFQAITMPALATATRYPS